MSESAIPELLATALELGAGHFEDLDLMRLGTVKKSFTAPAKEELTKRSTRRLNLMNIKDVSKCHQFLNWCRQKKTFDATTDLTVECPIMFCLPFAAAATCDDTGLLWRSAYHGCEIEQMIRHRFPRVETLHLIMHVIMPNDASSLTMLMPPPSTATDFRLTLIQHPAGLQEPTWKVRPSWSATWLQRAQNYAPTIHRMPLDPHDPLWADQEFRHTYANTINLPLDPNVMKSQFMGGQPAQEPTIWLPLNCWANAFNFRWPNLQRISVDGAIHVQMLDQQRDGVDEVKLEYLPSLKSVEGSNKAVIMMDDNMPPSLERVGGSDCVVMTDKDAIPNYTDLHFYDNHQLHHVETLWPPEPYAYWRHPDYVQDFECHFIPPFKHVSLKLTDWGREVFNHRWWGLWQKWPEGIKSVTVDVTSVLKYKDDILADIAESGHTFTLIM